MRNSIRQKIPIFHDGDFFASICHTYIKMNFQKYNIAKIRSKVKKIGNITQKKKLFKIHLVIFGILYYNSICVILCYYEKL